MVVVLWIRVRWKIYPRMNQTLQTILKVKLAQTRAIKVSAVILVIYQHYPYRVPQSLSHTYCFCFFRSPLSKSVLKFCINKSDIMLLIQMNIKRKKRNVQ